MNEVYTWLYKCHVYASFKRNKQMKDKLSGVGSLQKVILWATVSSTSSYHGIGAIRSSQLDIHVQYEYVSMPVYMSDPCPCKMVRVNVRVHDHFNVRAYQRQCQCPWSVFVFVFLAMSMFSMDMDMQHGHIYAAWT
jgi:hypothetical protein